MSFTVEISRVSGYIDGIISLVLAERYIITAIKNHLNIDINGNHRRIYRNEYLIHFQVQKGICDQKISSEFSHLLTNS